MISGHRVGCLLAWVAALVGGAGCKTEAPPEVVQPLPEVTVQYTEDRVACADRNPLRNVYWGDLHVHTRLSFDAYVYEIRSWPSDAYRFAKGEELLLPPLDENGKGTRPFKLQRPLDFAAVTDHAEYLAEVEACTTESSPGYNAKICQVYRDGGSTSYVNFGLGLADPEPYRWDELCGEGLVDCRARAESIWRDVIVKAAEDHDDKTDACAFTAFPAYEYSGSPKTSNYHRNVIFRNGTVPDFPTTYIEEPTAQGLWKRLRADCLDAGTGCDVLAIPHNTNWSNGTQMIVEYPGAANKAEEAAQAAERREMEPLVEIFQHKGDSECLNGFKAVLGAPDELCDFEKLRPPEDLQDCGEEVGAGAMIGVGCTHRLDFVRNVVIEGLVEQNRIGENPYRLGFIGSTDTHAAMAGATEENDWPGHLGTNDDDPEEALGNGGITPGGFIESPGGLAAVWAVENSRDALFDAMRRREVYATSGTRIALRLFGGWDYPEGICDDPNLTAIGYERGVPMGGELGVRGEAKAPVFVVQALRDPAQHTAGLQRLQIIKGWVSANGKRHSKVYDVAGNKNNGAGVNTDTCALTGKGEAILCARWSDPEFDSALHATYYARAVENPSCRWSTWWCNELADDEKPENCIDSDRAKTIQERAWSSPIWYTAP